MRVGVSTVFALFFCAVIASACSEKTPESTSVATAIPAEQTSDASIETPENKPAGQNCHDEKPKSHSAKDMLKSSINI